MGSASFGLDSCKGGMTLFERSAAEQVLEMTGGPVGLGPVPQVIFGLMPVLRLRTEGRG